MNTRIQKVCDEIERTKTKIAELQALLPELERKKTDMEDAEIVKLIRSANIKPGEVAGFIGTIKAKEQQSSAPLQRADIPAVITPARVGITQNEEDTDNED
jgi:hypothetical protein